MYIIFVRPPSTGKSQAINTGCVAPLDVLATNEDRQSFVIGKSTSAGLVSRLSEGDAMLVFNKMLKIDNDIPANILILEIGTHLA